MGARGSCFCIQTHGDKDVESFDDDQACAIPEFPSRRHSGIPPPPPRQRSRTLSNATEELGSILSSPRLRKYERKNVTSAAEQLSSYNAVSQDIAPPRTKTKTISNAFNTKNGNNTLHVPYVHGTHGTMRKQSVSRSMSHIGTASLSGLSDLSLAESSPSSNVSDAAVAVSPRRQCTKHVFPDRNAHYDSDEHDSSDDDDDEDDEDSVAEQSQHHNDDHDDEDDDEEEEEENDENDNDDDKELLSPASAAAASAHLQLSPNISQMSAASDLSQLSPSHHRANSAETHADDDEDEDEVIMASCTIIVTGADRNKRTRVRDSSLSTQSAPATLMSTPTSSPYKPAHEDGPDHEHDESSVSSMHQPNNEELDELDDDSDLEHDIAASAENADTMREEDTVETEPSSRWKTSMVSRGSADLDQRPSIITCSAVEVEVSPEPESESNEDASQLQQHLMLNVKSDNNRLSVACSTAKNQLVCDAMSDDSAMDSASYRSSNSSMSPQPDDIISDAYAGAGAVFDDVSVQSNIVVEEMTKYLTHRQKHRHCGSPKQEYID